MTEYADSGGVRIAWEERGSGPPVVLVHGLGYGRWGWEPLLPRLAADHRVVTFDNRGIGESDVPPGPYDAAVMATDVAAVLDAAGIDRAHLVGTSLGGMIAQEFAASRPERVDHLVLMSTTPGGPDAHPMPEATVSLLSKAASMAPAEALRAFVENALGHDPPPNVVDDILAHRLASPQDPAGWQAQAVAGTTFAPGDLAISAPTLIIHGDADRVVDPRNAELLATRIDGAIVRVVPGGHLMFWEDPATTADLILSFLETV